MALLIKSNKEKREVLPKDGQYFTLQEMYDLLECRVVEFVTLSDGRIMIVDEEGALQHNYEEQINIEATQLYKVGRMSSGEKEEWFKELEASGVAVITDDANPSDSIIGTVLVCNPNELKS